MKNILFLHSSSELYGSDRSLLNLLKNLDKQKYSLQVVLPCEGPLIDEIRKLDNVDILIKDIAVLRRKNLSLKGIFRYFIDLINSIKYLKKVVKEKNIDIIYTNTSVVFPGGITAKLLRKKSIWHVREIVSNKYERKIISIIVNLFSDIIIANSKATAEAISNNKNKVRVVYNAIESNIISNKVNNKQITVGMAGRINRWKGQKLFVDMAEDVLKQDDSIKFLIAGDVYKGEEKLKEDLCKYINEKGIEDKITLLGQVDNMSEFYNKLDIFVLPSIKPEPFGLVILEAMDNSIPVVATNHGGPTEIIEDNKSGFLVEYNNSKDMSNKVLKLIRDDNLRIKMGQNGKVRRESMFSVNKYVNSISEILSNI